MLQCLLLLAVLSTTCIDRCFGLSSSSEKHALREGSALLDVVNATRNHSVLCVTFLSYDHKPIQQLLSNLKSTVNRCDWALVFYDGDVAKIEKFCESLATVIAQGRVSTGNSSSSVLSDVDRSTRNANVYALNVTTSVRLCHRAPVSMNRRKVEITTADGSVTKQNLSIPKSVLYQELLPVLPFYNNTFILDEDISLGSFDIAGFMLTRRCAFWPDEPPLVVQPLIKQDTQYFPYVHLSAWMRYSKLHKGQQPLAATVGLVEQQVPFFHTPFLEWYIRSVLGVVTHIALELGVDQSLDKTWCRAAHMYRKVVLNDSSSLKNSGCAVVIGMAGVHSVSHTNSHSLQNKKANRKVYAEKAAVVNQYYESYFPHWVVQDLKQRISPLEDHRHEFQVVLHSAKYDKCVALCDKSILSC
jgi:hypothetical protein